LRAAFEDPAEGAADAGADISAHTRQHRGADGRACKDPRRHRGGRLVDRPAHGEGHAGRARDEIERLKDFYGIREQALERLLRARAAGPA